jgi:hypothetical protein
MDKYGDFVVGRTIVGKRRVNTGLSVESIAADRNIWKHDFQWLRLSAVSIQDAILPNATELELGWDIVVHVPASSGSTINVKTFHGTSPVLLRNIQKARAYKFTLVGNSNEAGEWYVDYLEELETLPTVRYIHSFLSSIGSPNWINTAGDYYTITVPASTHSLGVNPIAKIYEKSGTNYIEVMTDKTITANNGDVTIRVPKNPSLIFEGQIILI